MSTSNGSPGWIAIQSETLFIWHYEPQEAPKACVILVPPLGHEAFHSHRFYKLLASYLCSEGFRVVRFDWPGCGDSSGCTHQSAIHTLWQESLKTLIDTFAQGLSLNLIGLRFGANMASQFSAGQHVFLDPIYSPKRLVRELSATSKLAESQSSSESGLEAGGYYYSADLLTWLPQQSLNLGNCNSATFISSQPKKAEKLIGETPSVQIIEESELPNLLLEPQFTEIPTGLFERVGQQLSTSKLKNRANGSSSNLMFNHQRCDGWQESFIFDELGQFGIITEPTALNNNAPLLVFINSGSGVHTGPNRIYVELCRNLAKENGLRTCRFDLKNLGDSADATVTDENHCYPEDAKLYTQSFMDALKKQGLADKVILCGICSGAHHAYHAAIAGHNVLKEAMLINPLTFYWVPGMSLVTPDGQKVTVDSNYYAQKMKDPRAWLHLLKGKANIRYISTFAAKFALKKLASVKTSINRVVRPIPDTQMNRDMKTIQKNKVQLSILVADTDPGWGLLADATLMPKKSFLNRFNVKAATVDDANHTFSKSDSRVRLQQTIAQFLSSKEGVM